MDSLSDNIELLNNTDNDVNDKILPVPPLSMYSKLKRRIYWEVVERDAGRFNSYQEFKKAWHPSYKLRSIIKTECYLFKKDPLNYIKKERISNRIKLDNYLKERNKDFKSTRYVNGIGWYCSAEINSLHRQGYTIRNSIITKIR